MVDEQERARLRTLCTVHGGAGLRPFKGPDDVSFLVKIIRYVHPKLMGKLIGEADFAHKVEGSKKALSARPDLVGLPITYVVVEYEGWAYLIGMAGLDEELDRFIKKFMIQNHVIEVKNEK